MSDRPMVGLKAEDPMNRDIPATNAVLSLRLALVVGVAVRVVDAVAP